MALAQKYRLTGKKQFDLIKKRGRLIDGPLFSLLVFRSREKEGPKFGFIVSKRIDKRAVVRNRLRRVLAEAVRQILPEVGPDLRGIFLAKSALKKAELNQVLTLVRKKLGEFAEKKT